MLTRLLPIGMVFFATAVTAAPVFINADFETAGATDTGAVGWVRFGVSNTDSSRGCPNVLSPAPFGNCTMRLNAGGGPRNLGVTQTVGGFVVGNSYTITVQVGNYVPSAGSAAGLDFEIRSLLLGGLTSTSASSNSLGIGNTTNLWSELSHTFTADVASIAFQFAAQVTTDRSFVIDNVRVTANDVGAVPEPASLLLIGMGIAGLGWTRRKAAADR